MKSTAFCERESVVHFEGFVKYKDVIDGERETCFKKKWVVYEMGDKRSSIWVANPRTIKRLEDGGS